MKWRIMIINGFNPFMLIGFDPRRFIENSLIEEVVSTAIEKVHRNGNFNPLERFDRPFRGTRFYLER